VGILKLQIFTRITSFMLSVMT